MSGARGAEASEPAARGRRPAPPPGKAETTAERLKAIIRDAATPEDMGRRALAGTPAQVVTRIREYIGIGVTHFIGMFGRVDDLRSTRLFAEQVFPSFR